MRHDEAKWPPTREVLNERSDWFRRLDAEGKARLRAIHEPPLWLGPTRAWGHNSHRTGFTVPLEAGIFVYAHLDGFSRALYVGKTANPVKRISQHACKSPWWPEVRAVVYERQANELAAYWRELEIIKELDPTHNKVGKPRRSVA